MYVHICMACVMCEGTYVSTFLVYWLYEGILYAHMMHMCEGMYYAWHGMGTCVSTFLVYWLWHTYAMQVRM